MVRGPICRQGAMNGSIQITALVRQRAIIPHADFPYLLSAHLNRNKGPKGTVALENRGYALRTSAAMKWADLEAFVKDVCRWGDYAGISGRVLKKTNNSSTKVTDKVGGAILQLSSTPPDLVGALHKMTEIKGLGVSF